MNNNVSNDLTNINNSKKMRITCSNCRDNVLISYNGIQQLKNSNILCRKCGKTIRIVFCPNCGVYYSLVINNLKNQRYKMKCNICKNEFFLNLVSKISNKLPPPEKNIKQQEEKLTTPIPDKNNSYNLQNLLLICAAAFSIKKLLTASLAVIIFFMLSPTWYFIEKSIFSNLQYSGYLKSLLSLFPITIAFSLYLAAAASISKISLCNQINNNDISLKKSIFYFFKFLFSGATETIILLLILNIFIVFLARIPVIGPVYFSLIFLPLYLCALFATIMLSIGLWFSPPLIASNHNNGIINNIKKFFNFIKKYNFSLIYVISVLSFICFFIFSILIFFHHTAFYIVNLFTRTIPDNNSLSLFSALPGFFSRIGEFSLFGVNSRLLQIFSYNEKGLLIFSGSIIIGLVIMLLTILLLASFISIMSTLSTHIFILMEKNIDNTNIQKRNLLILLLLLFICIFIIKTILGSSWT